MVLKMLNKILNTDKNQEQPLDFFYNNFTFIHLFVSLKVILSHSFRHFHLQDTLAYDIVRLFPSVPIFFVASGFLVSASYARSKSFSDYITNRLFRIYPALYVSLGLSLIAMFSLYSPEFELKQFLIWLFGQMTIIQFYNPDYLRGYGSGVMNGSLWSISVQMQFYLLLPIILLCLKKYKNRLLWIALFTILMVINYVFYGLFKDPTTKTTLVKLFHVSIFPHLFLFLMGVFFQQNLNFINKYLKNNFLFFAGLYALSAFISAKLGLRYQGAEFNPILAIVLAMATMSFAYSYQKYFANFAKGYDISYGLYVYHNPIINVLLTLNLFNPQMNVVMTVIITIIIATLSLLYIEKPVMRFKKSF
jgi:peptidoglycan/LPS O-acetylase OafA/YrhL